MFLVRENQSTHERSIDMAKVRENEFTLSMAGIDHFSFQFEDYKITDGQLWEGVSIDETPDSGIIIVKAGRKGSEDTAEWFRKKAGKGSAIGCSSGSKYPEELNFAFTGTLTFRYANRHVVCENVLIGQGYRMRNTWWLGGPDMSGMITPFGGIVMSPYNGSTLSRVVFATYVGQISSMEMGIVAI
jgi:hypothetical protein